MDCKQSMIPFSIAAIPDISTITADLWLFELTFTKSLCRQITVVDPYGCRASDSEPERL
ncbi:MAG: hypothetical protein P8J86_09130 [Phycisphaerales bacterium]|nr:hypothetical protein [Phycisphaerales bacterium]